MSKQTNDSIKTSRRQFTGMAVSAAMAASLTACKSKGTDSTNQTAKQDEQECPAKLTVMPDYTEIIYGIGPIAGVDHIPPMGLEGGGSLVIDFRYYLNESGSGSGPYTYMEDARLEDRYRYGDIKGALVITETDSGSYLRKTEYIGFPTGTQLWIWYQEIDPRNPSGSPDEIDYKPLPNPLPDPDVTIRGGRASEYFRVQTKKKKLERHKSHKKYRPHRLKHTGGGGMPSHFRIGLWRFVKNNGTMTIVEGKGDENYTIYVDFGHYQRS
jgi:hypothetical protein